MIILLKNNVTIELAHVDIVSTNEDNVTSFISLDKGVLYTICAEDIAKVFKNFCKIP